MARNAAAQGNTASAASVRKRSAAMNLLRRVIPDSGDEHVDEVTDRSSHALRTASFKGVFVPLKDHGVGGLSAFSKKRLSDASSLSSSVGNHTPVTTRDNSEINTAETSLASTPGAGPSSLSKAAWLRGVSPSSIINLDSSATLKRKRKLQDVDTSADADLARALQEEEYGGITSSSKRPKSKSTSRLANLALSDDDDDDDEDFDMPDVPLRKSNKNNKGKARAIEEDISDSDVPPKRSSQTKGKVRAIEEDTSDSDLPLAKSFRAKGKAPLRDTISKLPSRKARSSAQATLAGISRLIADTEDDSSSLSDFTDQETDDLDSRSSGIRHFEGESLDEYSEDEAEADVAGPSNPFGTEDFETFTNRMRRGRKIGRAAREREKLEKAHPEVLTMWETLKAVPKISAEQAQQPESISRKLKSFQLEGLNWMIKQEQTEWRGGLLGDEMGMGKTIQAVSLIMSDYPTKPHKPTLVLVPPVALMQWTNEIRDYTSGLLKVLVYHGSNGASKKMTVKQLKAYDVIMCSYPGLESVFRKQSKGWTRGEDIIKEDSALHSIYFHRIILDEAHSIKSRTTGVAKACFALKGTYKWCLSGTPVQNRIGEFFSLLRFLDVQPFANYLCKKCPCSTPDWSTNGDYRCTHCKHRTLDHVSVFNQEILNPVISGENETSRKDGLAKLRLLTDRIMLRRMKRDYTSSMELPPKEIIIHNEFFGEVERDFSSSIMTNTNRQFDTYVSRGVMLNNYANIFGLIMQMRQVANHPDLLLKKHAETGQNVLVCNICDEPAEEAIRSRCKHEFCRVCVKDYVKTCEASDATPDCPRCHIPLSIDFEQPDIEQDSESVKKSSIINRIKMENWHSSTKIEMLVYDLYKLRSNKQTLKSIVFSQFTSMLQLIEWRLRRAGFNTVMLDGSMTPQQRQKSIDFFMTNTDVEVFLVSLKAGGVALNLTEASRVFIVDPWWNPAAEWQSADRCHRIGQKRPCVITRLCVEDSVESRIVMLQEKKANLISGCVNGDDVAMEKLTPEDMQFLFRGS